MTDRSTPEQIAIDYAHRSGMDTDQEARGFLDILAEHGYVIVHPDDQRTRDEALIRATCEMFGVLRYFTSPTPGAANGSSAIADNMPTVMKGRLRISAHTSAQSKN